MYWLSLRDDIKPGEGEKLMRASNTYALIDGLVRSSRLHMAKSLGKWQSWIAVTLLLGLISMA